MAKTKNLQDFSKMAHDFELVWQVQNISMSALSEELLLSPVLSVHFLHTKWRFHLKFIENKFHVWLQRCYDSGPEIVYVNLFNGNLDYRKLDPDVSKHHFKKGDIFHFVEFTKRYNACENHFIRYPESDKLTVQCVILPDSEYYNDFFQLSNDIRALLTKSQFSDVLLCTDNREIPVHLSILHARAGGLQIVNKYSLNRDALRIHIPEPDRTNFTENALLEYMYSGQVNAEVNVPAHFILSSNTFGIKKKFEGVSRKYIASTTIKIKTNSFRIDFIYGKIKREAIIRSYETFGLSWKLEIRFPKSRREKYCIRLIPSRLQNFSSLSKKSLFSSTFLTRYYVNIYCGCSHNLLGEFCSYYSNPGSSQNPLKEVEETVCINKNSLTKCCKKRKLHFYSAVFYGKCISTVEAEKPGYFLYNPLPDVITFSEDMRKLFQSTQFSDCWVNNFRAHKAILSARSPVLSNMLLCNMMDTIESRICITDLKDDIVNKLLVYIYCAQVEFSSVEEVIQLAYAADTYGLTLLKTKCFYYLEDHMNEDNALEIYVTSNILQNEELKNDVRKFVHQSGYYLLEKLQNFKQTWPNLYLEIFPQTIENIMCPKVTMECKSASKQREESLKKVKEISDLKIRIVDSKAL